jgi:DnaJ-class molecular chaperone
MTESFYTILGVSENCDFSEIKKAYRSKQMKYHPDKNVGNDEATNTDNINMTQKINEAYETLGDEEKKKEYDFQRKNKNPFMRMNSFENAGMNGSDEEILNMIFNGGFQGFPGFPGFPGMMQQGMPHSGTKLHMFHGGGPMGGGSMGFHQAISKPTPIIKTINVNLEQVLLGASIPVDIERWSIENGLKLFESETIYVTVPQGVDNNEVILLREKGNVLNDNLKGDVKIIVKIINETEFKRSGLDLILEKKITLKEALCGFTFEIKFLNNKSYTLNNLKGNIIPPEYKKTYANLGLTRGEHKGSLIINFHVEFPEKLTNDQMLKIADALS